LNSKSNFVAVVASSALMLVSAHANAFSTSVTAGSFSAQSGAFNIDFGTSQVNNSSPVGGSGGGADSVLTGSGAGVTYAYTGGALYNISTSPISGVTARPPGSTGNFYSVGTSPAAQTGPGQVAFSSGLSYFGFLWGSPDTYNTVSFFNGNTHLGSFTGSAVLNPANGNQSVGKYFNAFAGVNERITRVTFASTTNAFETDNHSFISAVPEPETYAMFMAGLGLLGFMAKRKKSV
jgi:hypothetical protein